MIKHHHGRLIHPNENEHCKLHDADSTPADRYCGILCGAQANHTKAEIMHAGQSLEFKREGPALALSNSVAGVVLSGINPRKSAFMFVHAVTFTP